MIEKTLAGMTQGMINKLVTVLETTLSKLSRYDEGSFIGSILSFTVRWSSMDCSFSARFLYLIYLFFCLFLFFVSIRFVESIW